MRTDLPSRLPVDCLARASAPPVHPVPGERHCHVETDRPVTDCRAVRGRARVCPAAAAEAGARAGAGSGQRQPAAPGVDHAVQDAALQPDQAGALPAGDQGGRRPEPQGNRRHRQQPAAADVREHDRGAREHRRAAVEGAGGVRRPAVGRDESPTAGRQPRGDAAAVGAARRGPAEREAVPADQGGVRPAGDAEADADPGQARRGGLQGLRARGREPRRGEEGAAEEDQRRAVDAHAEVRRQPAARHQRLQAGRSRSRTTSKGLPPSVVASGADAAKAANMRGQVGLHAAGAEHLAVPAVRGQPRAAAADPRRLHEPQRSRRRVGQQEGRCRGSRRFASSAPS